MRIIALDGASGSGKTVIISRLQSYFERTGRSEVRIERLLDKTLEQKLDNLKNEHEPALHYRRLCNELVCAYREGCNRLRELDAVYAREHNGQCLIFILDRYLLSLYAVQGLQWGIYGLEKLCSNIPYPDGQFIIRKAGTIRQEDQLFIDAARAWSNEFKGTIWKIQNTLSGTDAYHDGGFDEVKQTIQMFLSNN
ncbi:MAG: hypothetical protein NC485_14445 [Ruminococcus flavefaciens]|nr:hypothetical protein [Ruminococcus flavefaciens]